MCRPPTENADGGTSGIRAVRRSDFEADNPVGLIAPGGQHQDRHIARAADLFEHLEPVEAGEHQVEDHRMPVFGLGAFDTIDPGMHGMHLVSERREV